MVIQETQGIKFKLTEKEREILLSANRIIGNLEVLLHNNDMLEAFCSHISDGLSGAVRTVLIYDNVPIF